MGKTKTKTKKQLVVPPMFQGFTSEEEQKLHDAMDSVVEFILKKMPPEAFPAFTRSDMTERPGLKPPRAFVEAVLAIVADELADVLETDLFVAAWCDVDEHVTGALVPARVRGVKDDECAPVPDDVQDGRAMRLGVGAATVALNLRVNLMTERITFTKAPRRRRT